MKLRNLFLGVCSAVAVFAACQPQEENLGTPDISIDKNEMTFEVAGGEQQLAVTATRDWKVETDADWVVVSPESGAGSLEPQTVTVTALENTGMDRSADLKFTIGMKSKYLTVSQAGPGGSVEALIVYSNDFDKEEATKTYGSSNGSWPYLDQFEGWKNATGTGAANVTYSFQGMSARANSTSDSNYSDYAGSGKNNMFFGSAAYFSTNNIALNGATGLTLTFGTEKYSQDNGSVFTNSEYKIFLSNDGAKWVELTDYTFAGGTTEGRWNIATANFTVPEGTENLSICMQVTVASSYRMDDMKLVMSEGGAAVDFSKGVEMDFAAGNTGGGNQGGGASDANAIYSNNYDKSAAVQGSNGWPFLDSSDAWKNAAGTGAANVTYASKNVTVRNNSNSNGNYSDYDGSGLNNIFFGKDYPYFATKNIALGGATGLTLTFGTEKYSQTLGSTFTNSEYHIYLSNDGTKWVELTDYTFAGTADGRWNVATANFTVPAGTENLSICMQVDAASAYRLDDFKLVASEGGATVDFSAAVEKDFNAGATGGGNEGGETPTPPAGDGSVVTIAEFLANGGSAIEGIVISNMDLNNLTSKKGMYIQDETAGLQFYLAANHTFAFGDKVRVDVSGVSVGEYNGAVQISGLALDKITKISSGNTVTPKTVTMADFLANKYEGQYVAIEGVQVADADLSKTFVMGGAHTSIKVEDANGNSFVIFSSKYATYGTQTVPQGSGTIKGISSINNGNMQIIFAQNSDFAGLTGTRFDGTEVTPPAGGGDEGGEDPVTPPSGGEGQYDSNITWTLGANAYDGSSSSSQKATINGIDVDNILKLGKSKEGGSATLNIPAGTSKVGFYAVGWKGNTVKLNCSVGGQNVELSIAANDGASGNPEPRYIMTVSESDYYTIDIPSGATEMVLSTTGTSNCRAIIFGIKTLSE
ncbi:MAG: hypothetical protein J6Q63_06555 [Bacteroidales bacterium]|nr:hypothetical protein [Bacteroidales bacterium]MBO5942934.1 hypothetical protein [Bacteroidales bacterium]